MHVEELTAPKPICKGGDSQNLGFVNCYPLGDGNKDSPPKRCILSTMHTTVFRSPSSPPPFTNRRPTEGKSFHLINLALGETSTGKGQCDQNALCTCMKLSKSGLQSETMTAVSAALSPPPVGYPAPFLLRGGRQNWESNLTSQNSY